MKRMIDRIPGAWYGNDPGDFGDNPKQGNVAVDPSRLVDAVSYLRKRCLRIDPPTIRDEPNGHSVILSYELR